MADQLCGNHTADQHLCFCYIEGTILILVNLNKNFKPLSFFFCFTVWFLLDLVGNPQERFSGDTAQLNEKTCLMSLSICNRVFNVMNFAHLAAEARVYTIGACNIQENQIYANETYLSEKP